MAVVLVLMDRALQLDLRQIITKGVISATLPLAPGDG